MVNLSLREAVKAFNVSRPTLTKAINSGKISGVRNGKQQWEINPAELARVYQPRNATPSHAEQPSHDPPTTQNKVKNDEVERLQRELAIAEAKVEAAERLAQERLERIEDLRRMLPAATASKSVFKWPWSKR